MAKAIAEAVAQQTQTIADVFQRQIEAVSRQKSEETQALTDVFQRQMEETRAQYQELLKQVAHKNSLLPLKWHLVQMVLE